METPPVSVKKTIGLSHSSTKSSLTPCRRVGLGRPSSGSFKKSLQLRSINTPVQSESNNVSNVNTVLASSNTPKVPLKLNDSHNKRNEVLRVRRCLTVDSKTPNSVSANRIFSSDQDIKQLNLSHDVRTNSGEPNDSSDISTSDRYKKRKHTSKPTFNCDRGMGEEKKSKTSSSCKTSSPQTSIDCNQIGGNPEITEKMIELLASSLVEKKKKLELFKVQETYAKKHNLEDLWSLTAKWRTAGQDAMRYCVSLAKEAGYPVTIPQLMTQHGFPSDLMGYNAEDDEFD